MSEHPLASRAPASPRWSAANVCAEPTEAQLARVNVIGISGSGKSTFARRLAKLLDAPHVEMDAVYWEPRWTEPSDAVFFARLRDAIVGERWVLDGNYSRTREVKWARVTTVIWLDYPLAVPLYRVIARSFRRALSGREIWPGTGNVETLSRLFSRQSVVLWTLRNHRIARRRYLAAMQDPMLSQLCFIRLRTPRAADHFLRTIATRLART